MTAFADSSALVKLYVDELGRAVVRRRHDLVVAEIAGVEVPAAFWRKHRLGDIAAADARVLTAAFQADLFGTSDEEPRFITVSSAGSVLREAAELVARHPLRGYDAVQLASAIAVRRIEPSCSTLLTFDVGLGRAGSAEGFEVMP